MANLRFHASLYAAASAIALLATSGTASAGEVAATSDAASSAGSTNDSGDIIVTARKRHESLLNVPVIEEVISADTLQTRQTVDLKDLTSLTPGLMIATTVLSIGDQVTLRGVGTSSFDPGIDQSVSLNIDGLSLGNGLAMSSGMFDVGQIEVLEGPQALFYGKSSPGGVIALRTADPTDKTEVIGSVGYESEARTKRTELIISGPLSNTVKARLAGMWSQSDGYYYNAAVVTPTQTADYGGRTPAYNRMDFSRNYQLRGTVLWDPAPNFSARLKVNLVHDYAVNPESDELADCQDGTTGPGAGPGVPFINPADSCKKGRTGYVVDYNPANFPGILNNGTPFVQTDQLYGTLELNWHATPQITVTSLTSLYDLHSSSLTNTSQTGLAGPSIAAQNPNFRKKDFSQELRVNTDFTTPLNVTAGALYDHGSTADQVDILANNAPLVDAVTGNSGTYGFISGLQSTPFPAYGSAGQLPLTNAVNQFEAYTGSIYGQLRYKVTSELELAAGARWTDETRTENPVEFYSLAFGADCAFDVFTTAECAAGQASIPVPTPRIHSDTISPEFTVTYKPSTDLTLFAAYKEGHKSGSFSIATPATPGTDNSFGDESVSGGELGVKGRLADHQIHFSLSGFDYLYKGLQVGAVEPTTNSLPVIATVNAGSGRSYGLEFDSNYRPDQVPGLGLNLAVNWTHARFNTLDNVPCYGGQTVAGGCTQVFAAFPLTSTSDGPTQTAPGPGYVTVGGKKGYYTAQNLNGTPFVRAPNWQVNFGFDYQLPVGSDKTLTISNANHFTSSFLTGLGLRSDYVQANYLKVDLSLSLHSNDKRWELALIGKNLTEQYTVSNCAASNYQYGLEGGEVTGGTTVGPAGTDEQLCYMDPGRELWIRLTLRR